MGQVDEALQMPIPLLNGGAQMIFSSALSWILDVLGVDEQPGLLVTVSVMLAIGHNRKGHSTGRP